MLKEEGYVEGIILLIIVTYVRMLSETLQDVYSDRVPYIHMNDIYERAHI